MQMHSYYENDVFNEEVLNVGYFLFCFGFFQLA